MSTKELLMLITMKKPKGLRRVFASPRFRKLSAVNFNSDIYKIHSERKKTNRIPTKIVGNFDCTIDEAGSAVINGTTNKPVAVFYIFIDGVLVKDVSANKNGNFRYKIKKGVMSKLPLTFRISVSCNLGVLVASGGGYSAVLDNSNGTAESFEGFSGGRFLSKKGNLTSDKSKDTKWQNVMLDSYVELSDYFHARFGYKLILTYGTLLGKIRDQDFIAHDDDFDVCYFSDKSDILDVKREFLDIIERMKIDGLDFKLGMRRNMIKVNTEEGYIDIFPSWHDGVNFWMPIIAKIKSSRDMIEPVRKDVFKGRVVYEPNNPVEFLEKHYGSGWKVPDSSYKERAKKSTREYLKSIAPD